MVASNTLNSVPQARSGYRELERIVDADGAMAVLSLRVSGPPIVTLAIFKLFMRDGVEDKTAFFSHKQIESVKRVLDIAGPRARELEAKYQGEYEIAKRPGR